MTIITVQIHFNILIISVDHILISSQDNILLCLRWQTGHLIVLTLPIWLGLTSYQINPPPPHQRPLNMSMQISSLLSTNFMVGVGVGTNGVSCEWDQLSEGTGTRTTMIWLPISIASRPSSSSNTSGVGAGAGVALLKRKLNTWPRVDSSEMDDGSETGILRVGSRWCRRGRVQRTLRWSHHLRLDER